MGLTLTVRILWSFAVFILVTGQSPSSPPSSPSSSYIPSSPSSTYTPSSPPSSYIPSSPSTPYTPSTPSTEGGGEEEESLGIDQGDGGKADNLADYFIKKVSELINGVDDDDDDEYEDTSDASNTTVDDSELRKCNLTATLDRYCEAVPQSVYDFFNNDLSIQGLLNAIFKPDVVQVLRSNCTRGAWCLPDYYHQDIISGMDRFYRESPFCSDAMWTCLQKILDLRFECDEKMAKSGDGFSNFRKPLNYLVDSVSLLCDMEAVDELGQECYARATEALYVSYSDVTDPDGSHASDLEKNDCNDFRIEMTKSYLCADSVCGFDQNLLLESFETWMGITDDASNIVVSCNITVECQSDYDEDDDDGIEYYYYDGETTEDAEDYEEEMEKIEQEIQKELEEAEEEMEDGEYGSQAPSDGSYYYEGGDVNANADGATFSEDDPAMMFGLISMTTVLVLGLIGLVFVGYKRYKRARFANYRRGYSQLTDEESKMLGKEFK